MKTFPSGVIPAEKDFLASMSVKMIFLTCCGELEFDSDPVPSSPLRPKPQDHACPCGCALRKVVGRRKAVVTANAESSLVRNMLICI